MLKRSEFEKEELQRMKIEDIKFKAKRLDGKGWVCGYFYEENDNTYIIENRQKESKLNRNLTYQVDPSTVCMFTGLTDCEGKELFEHDLIHFVGFTHTAEVIWSEGNYAFMVVSENKHSYWLHNVIKVCRIERIGNKFDKKKQRVERQITISIEEYNKLIDMHTKREELPKRIEVKKFTSKWWKWLKRASCSLFHYNKNVEQQKLIKRCINEMSSVLLDNLYGYWRGDLSDYLKDRSNLEYFMRGYKNDAYRYVMEWLDKKKQRMRLKKIEDMKGTFGVIYKAKIDAYNSYYQHMRLLGKVNETLSFAGWLKNISSSLG